MESDIKEISSGPEGEAVSGESTSAEKFVDATDFSVDAYEGEDTGDAAPDAPEESATADSEQVETESDADGGAGSSRKYAELVKQQREIQREKEALAASQAQLREYVHSVQSAMQNPDTAAKLLASMGIDVGREVGRIARAKLGLDEEAPDPSQVTNALVQEIQNLRSQVSELNSGYHESNLRRTTERQIGKVLESISDSAPFLTEAIQQDPDIVDKIVDTAVKAQKSGKNVDLLQLLQESEAIVERDVKAAYSWAFKNPRLRKELGAMFQEGGTPPPAKVAKGGTVSRDDKLSIASREPSGSGGELTVEDLDRMMMEEALGRA